MEEKISQNSGGGTIIIMDDEECIRDSLSLMLMSMGYDVLHMEEGEEVIFFFKEDYHDKEEISCIILDLVIPHGMGGKETVLEIRKILPDIPVFAISGHTDDPVILNPREYGFTSSLRKPFFIKDLTELLSKYL